MGVPFWDTSPASWDTLFISGKPVPGLAKISGKLAQKIDVKKAPGTSGAKISFQGVDPAEFTVTLRLWEEPQLQALPDLLNRLRPVVGVAPTAVDLGHPVLSLVGIKAGYVKEISLLEEREKGIYELRLSFVEFTGPQTTGAPEVKPDIRKAQAAPAAGVNANASAPSKTAGAAPPK